MEWMTAPVMPVPDPSSSPFRETLLMWARWFSRDAQAFQYQGI
jgi:hypothetical protein